MLLLAYGLLLAAAAFGTVLLEVLVVEASQKFGKGHRHYREHEEKYLFLAETVLMLLVLTAAFALGGHFLP